MVEHVNSSRLKVVFTTLIIRSGSLLKHYSGPEEFSEQPNADFISNGELILTRDMIAPSTWLEGLSESYLKPLGLKYRADYAIAEEQMTTGVGGRLTDRLGSSIPFLEDLDWLESDIGEFGNWVWLKESTITENEDDFWRDCIRRVQKSRSEIFSDREINIINTEGEEVSFRFLGMAPGVLHAPKDFLLNRYFELRPENR